jgi:Spy/CpxP family protein refolding chaperone
MTVGLLLGVALVTAAQAQAPKAAQRGGGLMAARGGTFLGLLSVEQVQKELKLSDEQVGKVKQAAEKTRAEMRDQWAGLQQIEDRQQRRAKMTELTNQGDEKARNELRDVLSQEQWTRLYQIRLQVRGAVYALNNKWIAERLKLTPEQAKKAAEIDKAMQDKVYEAFGGLRDLSEEQRREKMAEVGEKVRKIRADADKQAIELLTAEQKEALEKRKGDKFEL